MVDGWCSDAILSSSSIANRTLPGVLALTRRSRVDVGLGLVIIGRNGVCLSSRYSQIALELMAGWWRTENMVTFGCRVLFA